MPASTVASSADGLRITVSPAPGRNASFHWALEGDVQPLALEFTLETGPANLCTLAMTDSARMDGPGPFRVGMLEWNGITLWAHGTSATNGPQAHVLSQETGQDLDNGTVQHGWKLAKVPLNGTARFTLLGDGFVPDGNELAPGVSVAGDFACRDGFTVSARRGAEVWLEDSASLRGGAGGSLIGVAAGVQDRAARTLSRQPVRAMVSMGGLATVHATLDRPGGKEDWWLTPPTDGHIGAVTRSVDTGAGDFAVTVDMAKSGLDGSLGGGYWFGVWTLEQPVALAQFMRAESAITNPRWQAN